MTIKNFYVQCTILLNACSAKLWAAFVKHALLINIPAQRSSSKEQINFKYSLEHSINYKNCAALQSTMILSVKLFSRVVLKSHESKLKL